METGKRIDKYVSDYVVFDLETTGVSTRRDQIIEISALKIIDHKVEEEFSTLVDPERPIPAGATMVNHITDEMVCGMPSIEMVLPRFLEFVGDYILLGQNIARFDMQFIYRDSKKVGETCPRNDFIDTLPLARMTLPELSHHKMTDLATYFGISTSGAHRALADCYMTYQVYERLGPMIEAALEANPTCPKCGQKLQRRNGKFGPFWGCSAYPKCTYTANI